MHDINRAKPSRMIYHLTSKGAGCRSVQASRFPLQPGVKKNKKLREDGYILMSTDHLIFLTEKGYTIARKIRNRHQVLMKLQPGVPEETAREDACRMERDLSDESSDAIRGQIA